ncbi:MAG TPA: glyoxalase superfamily protein [Acidimicrobiia bacterium]|jgi:predicted enzyme related to lactoylglutathione lyase
MDFRIELVPVPVTDVDRAIAFYTEQMGFDLDHDHTVSDDLRFVQLTPPGSACSITVGVGITEMAPGTQQIQMVVEDIEAARQELVSRGAPVRGVDSLPWGDFLWVDDPDGNRWSIQYIRPDADRV